MGFKLEVNIQWDFFNAVSTWLKEKEVVEGPKAA